MFNLRLKNHRFFLKYLENRSLNTEYPLQSLKFALCVNLKLSMKNWRQQIGSCGSFQFMLHSKYSGIKNFSSGKRKEAKYLIALMPVFPSTVFIFLCASSRFWRITPALPNYFFQFARICYSFLLNSWSPNKLLKQNHRFCCMLEW